MNTEVTFNAEKERYEITVDGEFAGHVDAIEHGGIIKMPHTVVLEKFGGRGVAGILVGAALDDIRTRGKMIAPRCPYIVSFIEKNPAYGDLVA